MVPEWAQYGLNFTHQWIAPLFCAGFLIDLHYLVGSINFHSICITFSPDFLNSKKFSLLNKVVLKLTLSNIILFHLSCHQEAMVKFSWCTHLVYNMYLWVIWASSYYSQNNDSLSIHLFTNIANGLHLTFDPTVSSNKSHYIVADKKSWYSKCRTVHHCPNSCHL